MKIEYTTKEGFGLSIEVTPNTGESKKSQAKYYAKATILKMEELKENESMTDNEEYDLLMGTAIKQVMEMKHWPEMFEVECTNFDVGVGMPNGEIVNVEDLPDDEPHKPISNSPLFGGPISEA